MLVVNIHVNKSTIDAKDRNIDQRFATRMLYFMGKVT